MPIAIIFLIYIQSLILYILDTELNSLIYFSSHLIAAAGCFLYLRVLKIDRYNCLKIVSAVIIVCFLLTIISSFVIDSSWDGMAYHQEAVLQLHLGWNPIYQTLPVGVENSVWIENYPKMTWIFSNVMLDIYKSIEAGKVIHFYLHSSLFLSCFFILIAENFP